MPAPAPWTDAPWTPRRWQAEALPVVLDELRRGNRAIVSAIMGAGKSILIAELVWLACAGKKPDHQIVVSSPRKRLVNQPRASRS